MNRGEKKNRCGSPHGADLGETRRGEWRSKSEVRACFAEGSGGIWGPRSLRMPSTKAYRAGHEKFRAHLHMALPHGTGRKPPEGCPRHHGTLRSPLGSFVFATGPKPGEAVQGQAKNEAGNGLSKMERASNKQAKRSVLSERPSAKSHMRIIIRPWPSFSPWPIWGMGQDILNHQDGPADPAACSQCVCSFTRAILLGYLFFEPHPFLERICAPPALRSKE